MTLLRNHYSIGSNMKCGVCYAERTYLHICRIRAYTKLKELNILFLIYENARVLNRFCV
jgi:hypothetical protein